MLRHGGALEPVGAALIDVMAIPNPRVAPQPLFAIICFARRSWSGKPGKGRASRRYPPARGGAHVRNAKRMIAAIERCLPGFTAREWG
jgi:hypothetical protein